MPDATPVIEAKVKAFAKDITAFLDKKRADKIAELKKKDAKTDHDKALVTVSFAYSSGKGSLSRSPEQQARYVSDGTSWTCAGAHMVDMARHVNMTYGAAGKKGSISWKLGDAFGSKDQHFCTLSDLKTKWAALMKTHGLKNHKGGDGMGAGDEFHFELAASKVPHSDKRVQACLKEYARLTRIEGAKKNDTFEKDAGWKGDLKPHIDAAEKEAAKKEEDRKKEELKKMSFDGATSGAEVLLRGVNKSAAVTGKALAAIEPPSPLDTGKITQKPVTAMSGWTWDSLARELFEYLGLAETRGFDVKLSCGISYTSITHEYLSQSFIKDLKPNCAVQFNTPAAKAMGMTCSVKTDVKLAKSGKGPAGTVEFSFELKTPIDKDKGTITFSIDGPKVTAKARLG